MILTDPRLHYQFTDYGILIPIRATKITKVLEHLAGLSELRNRSWNIARISEPATERRWSGSTARTMSTDSMDRNLKPKF